MAAERRSPDRAARPLVESWSETLAVHFRVSHGRGRGLRAKEVRSRLGLAISGSRWDDGRRERRELMPCAAFGQKTEVHPPPPEPPPRPGMGKAGIPWLPGIACFAASAGSTVCFHALAWPGHETKRCGLPAGPDGETDEARRPRRWRGSVWVPLSCIFRPVVFSFFFLRVGICSLSASRISTGDTWKPWAHPTGVGKRTTIAVPRSRGLVGSCSGERLGASLVCCCLVLPPKVPVCLQVLRTSRGHCPRHAVALGCRQCCVV